MAGARVDFGEILIQKCPVSAIEYGSGISTALLATYARQTGCRVKSYDSDEGWCNASNQFLAANGWAAWATCENADGSISSETTQFTLWDYDKNPMRVDLMPAAFESLEAGGVMYVDDMHRAEIREGPLPPSRQKRRRDGGGRVWGGMERLFANFERRVRVHRVFPKECPCFSSTPI